MTERQPPTRIGEDTWRSVDIGEDFVCGVTTAGRLFCWGRNEAVFAGATAIQTPTERGAGRSWKRVAASVWHVCAVDASARTWCWGLNRDGQTGQPPSATVDEPTVVGADADWGGGGREPAHLRGARQRRRPLLGRQRCRSGRRRHRWRQACARRGAVG